MQAGDGRIVDMTGKGEKGRQEVWLINSEGEFSVAGLLQHVGDPSLCRASSSMQRSLISPSLCHIPPPQNTSENL
ncbi:hypothetical protein CesoFtcFv8_017491 [Champsocephalus esox]|uniref:Uncharacterized protein n=1 Tax=Champsocephalus esox TaxID=159716 RepID=A0AAN8GQT2_9TELE|nr:hypothetical protein CesoFtcFv8_017491 [Champsocephalus esox]